MLRRLRVAGDFLRPQTDRKVLDAARDRVDAIR